MCKHMQISSVSLALIFVSVCSSLEFEEALTIEAPAETVFSTITDYARGNRQ